MTKEQKIELKRYKSALIQYKIAQMLPFLSIFLKTDTGFCNHFNAYLLVFGYPLPTLNTLRPKSGYMYWFPEGQLKPRIELLKQAIHILKQQ